MHDRSTWWRPEDHPGRQDWRSRPREDRPYWWRDDNLPFDHDEERARRAYDEEREREARYRAYESERRRRNHHRGWGDRAADEVKSWFGNERAERRREMDQEIEAREDERDRRDERHERRDYRGVGPRMRHDDDEDLREEINDRLRDDPDLDASDILVRVIDNEAILDGAVRSKRDLERAQHLADDVPGVVYVRNRLRVGRSSDDRVRRATIGMGYDDRPSRRVHRERRWS